MTEIAPLLYQIILETKEQKEFSSIQRKITQESFHSPLSKTQISHLVLHEILFISESGSSFYCTQLESFQDWMKELGQPLLSQQTLSSSLLELVYHAVRVLCKKKMGLFSSNAFTPAFSSFSITFDGWMDIGKRNFYLAVTQHWFEDNSWTLHSSVFDVIPFLGHHTAIHLATEIQNFHK